MYSDSALILFSSTRLFIRALTLCESARLSVRALSVPDAITSGCGMCLGLSQDTIDPACQLLQKEGIAGRLYSTHPYNLIKQWN